MDNNQFNDNQKKNDNLNSSFNNGENSSFSETNAVPSCSKQAPGMYVGETREDYFKRIYGGQPENVSGQPLYGGRPGYGNGQPGYVSQPGYGSGQPYGGQQTQYGSPQQQNQQYYALDNYYNSPYYINNQRKNEKRSLILALTVVAIIVFGVIGIGSLFMSISESNAKETITVLEESIEDAYNIEIYVGNDVSIYEEGFTIEKMNNEKTICRALENLEIILERLPEGFIDDIMDGYDEGRYLEIHITGSMVQKYDNRDVLGLTTYDEEKDIIRLNADIFSWSEYRETVAHELFHVIDFEMDQFNEYNNDIRKWENCNPGGFEYSYEEGQYSDYTIGGESISNVYFVSYYSKEDIYEDRAEIFSFLLATSEDDDLPEAYRSSHIESKAKLLIEEIEDHFSTADGEDVYWKQWYD